MIADNKIEILKEAGLDIKQGLEYTGGEDNYISAVQRFYKGYEKNRPKIMEYYSARDYNSYMITVHALKSNAKMIGAMELSKAFEELETAAKNSDAVIIEEKNNQTLESYKQLAEALKPIGEMEEVHPDDEISATEAREVADKLLSALDDFDDSLSKGLAEKLLGYPFRITQREKLKEAIGFIDDFMYDDAADIIKEIYSGIE